MSIKGRVLNFIQKINKAQPRIAQEYSTEEPTQASYTFKVLKAYEDVAIFNRGVNLLVNACASIDYDVGKKLPRALHPGVRKKALDNMLNFSASPHIGKDEYRRNLFLDLLLHGDAFTYFDGANLFNLPSALVDVVPSKRNFIQGYKYDETPFDVDDIIRVRDNSIRSIYRGTSRLESTRLTVEALQNMLLFQRNFFKNGAIPGLILKSPNVLSNKVKERILHKWSRDYNATTGGRRPLILDGEFDIEPLGPTDIRELDFTDSVKTHEDTILQAMGIPSVLIKGGNNANIRPNLEQFYSETVLPIVNMYVNALEMYFGYDIKPITQNILGLRADLKEQANYHSTLVNAGIFTRNESRDELRKEELKGHDFADDLILPANVAGSAQSAAVGGRPEQDPNDNKEDDNKVVTTEEE